MSAVETEWFFISKGGAVVHQLKVDSKAARPEQCETLCGRLIKAKDLRDAKEYAGKCMKCWMRAERARPQLTHVTPDEVARLEKSKMQKIDGYVYCLTHTCVHEETTDPYEEGRRTCLIDSNGSGIGVKKEDVHRTIHVRWKSGDYPDV